MFLSRIICRSSKPVVKKIDTRRSLNDIYTLYESNFTKQPLRPPKEFDVALFETKDFTVLSSIKKDHTVFTQGFLLDTEDTFIESGGLYGQSILQRISKNKPTEVLQKIKLDNEYFGEGVTLFKDKLYQLTWREGKM